MNHLPPLLRCRRSQTGEPINIDIPNIVIFNAIITTKQHLNERTGRVSFLRRWRGGQRTTQNINEQTLRARYHQFFSINAQAIFIASLQVPSHLHLGYDYPLADNRHSPAHQRRLPCAPPTCPHISNATALDWRYLSLLPDAQPTKAPGPFQSLDCLPGLHSLGHRSATIAWLADDDAR